MHLRKFWAVELEEERAIDCVSLFFEILCVILHDDLLLGKSIIGLNTTNLLQEDIVQGAKVGPILPVIVNYSIGRSIMRKGPLIYAHTDEPLVGEEKNAHTH